MRQSRWFPQGSLPAHRRRGLSYQLLFVIVPILGAGLALAFSLFPRSSWGGKESGPMVHEAQKAEFLHEITERGEVESSSNVEIRCEVQALGTAGTTILEVVPEGTYVHEGDVLVKLDSSSLKTQLTQQQIVWNTSAATEAQARNTYETAKIAKREYLDGVYLQDEETIQGEILVAKEDLRRAEQSLKYSRDLWAKGYVTKLQLEADQFAVEKAQMSKNAAETKLRVLQHFTKEKMLTQLDSDVKTGQAKLQAEEHSHQLDTEKMRLIETQIEKCTITAPCDGQVVYANSADNRGGGAQIVIEEGTQVRERQVIIRLPDPKKMRVKAKINEAKVALVVVGMPAVIHLDAFPEMELTGEVEKVNEYPAPTAWFGSNVKEYETLIRIDKSPPGLRPGLTAEVKIRVARVPDVLQVPVQAVLEHGGKHYCLFCDEDGWNAKEIEIGQSNDKFVMVRSGLKPGEQVVLGAVNYRDKVTLPVIPQAVASKRAPRGGKSPANRPGAKPEKPPEAAKPGQAPKAAMPAIASVGERFDRLDKKHDGRLAVEDLPADLRPLFPKLDRNGDGRVDRSEWLASASQLQSPGRNAASPGRNGP